MDTPSSRPVIFSGFLGAMFFPGSVSTHEIRPALDIVFDRNIPLIPTCELTADQVIKILNKLDRPVPFIVECGGAIYIPKHAFHIGYNYQSISKGYRVIEFGVPREEIIDLMFKLRNESNFNFKCLSELSQEQILQKGIAPTPEDYNLIQNRNYSEIIFLEGNHQERRRFENEVGEIDLRIKDHDEYLIITGDHDEGNAVRFLTQLYREEFKDAEIETIGLGSSWMDAPMLYAVDTSVLIRKANGRFDGRVGKRGLKFTKDPGPIGWRQAVIALLTEELN